MTLQEVQQRINGLGSKAKWVIAIPLILFGGPIMFSIAYTILGAGLVALAFAFTAAVIAFLVNMAPVMGMKFANWKLAALKAEAERNPIETLQNQQRELEKGLKSQEKAITDFDTEVENYATSLTDEIEKGFPEAAAKGLPTLNNMRRLLAYRRLKYKKAQEKILQRARKVQQAESEYRVALAAKRVTAAAGEDGDTVLNQILENIAFKSVESTVNSSMAELRTAIMVEEIPHDDTDANVIDVQAKEVKQLTNQPSMDLNALRLAIGGQTSDVSYALKG